jgi:glycosyltransferase involved in cell wall biosynthesis
MSTLPTVSVVIPTFNRGQTLRRAIDSVLAQSFKDFEIIVVDDGSTDGTKELLREYIDKKKIRYLFQRHSGAGAARNFGIGAAEGKYIAFQDSDDEWLPGKLEIQVESMERAGPSVGVVYCDMWKSAENHELLYWKAPQIEKGKTVDEKTLDYQAFNLGLVTVLARKAYLEKEEGFDESLPRLIDLDLFVRLSRTTNFYYMPQPLVKVYSSEGISISPKALATARIIMLQKYFDLVSRKKIYIANQYIKIAEALWKAGESQDAKRYCLNALQTYPYNPRITAKAIIIPLLSAKTVGRWPVSLRKVFY